MYHTNNNGLIYQYGMTLIELMLALTLTVWIVGSLSAIYLAAVKNHLAETALQNIQQNSRVAFQLLNSAIRSAGFIGCARLQNDFQVKTTEAYTITPANRVQAYHGSEIKPGTNALTIRYASMINNTLLEAMHAKNTLHVTATPKISVGEALLISNCLSAEIFSAQQVIVESDNTQEIISSHDLSQLYDKNAELSELQINTFYVGRTDRKNVDGSTIYALYMKDITQRKTELVEGIDSLQIHYSVLENGNMIEHNENDILDWSAVRGVSLQALLISLNYFPLEKTEFSYVALREVL